MKLELQTIYVNKQLNSQYRTIAYSSMTFSQAQTKYSTIERELVAIRWGVKTFRPFIFGVPFILYTDHKPLLYLHNMAHENSRLMRTITELAEFDFVIKYRPGKENGAADTMSRIVDVPSEEQYNNLVKDVEIPKGFRLIKIVEGGGNSLFDSIMSSLDYLKAEYDDLVIPEDQFELRKIVLDHILENPDKFNIKLVKSEKNRLNVMKTGGQVPSEEVLLATCDLFNLEIWIYHGMPSPVVYKVNNTNEEAVPVIHLQCISGIHFNPLCCPKKRDWSKEEVDDKNYVLLSTKKIQIEKQDYIELKEEQERVQALVAGHTSNKQCLHNLSPVSSCVVSVDKTSFCALLDTGAQISLLSEGIWKVLQGNDLSLKMLDGTGNILNGIDKSQTSILGIVELQLSMLDTKFKSSLPFAVIKEEFIPCCCVLGANFLIQNNIIIDYQKLMLYDPTFQLVYPLVASSPYTGDRYRYNVSALLCSVTQGDETDDSEMAEKSSALAVRFTLDTDRLVALQNNDHTVKSLKNKLTECSLVTSWEDSLQPFKRYQKQLRVQSDLLLKDSTNSKSVPVVPFPLLVEIIYKTHVQLGHVGRTKMIEVVGENFWHPSLDSVTRDVCNSCTHCQLFKISAQAICPPIIKIQAEHPFDLVAIDLLQFTKSTRNNVAVVMVIDHYSKFLTAIPIKDKRACTVSRALSEQVLPRLLKVPLRILTDNGPEFRSAEFNEVLDNFNIKHIYSTKYKASGNGAVERSNRTITQILKGLIKGNPNCWDVDLHKAVIIYNNTLHSQIGTTPAQYLLQTAHKFNNTLPVDTTTISTWREGHPKFSPFKINQKVAYKINKIGNQLKYKLGKKYEGPFIIVKVQTNGVTYELQKCSVVKPEPLVKVHHRQIKLWNDPPDYLIKYLEDKEEDSTLRTKQVSSESDELPSFLGFETSSTEGNKHKSKASVTGSSTESTGSSSDDNHQQNNDLELFLPMSHDQESTNSNKQYPSNIYNHKSFKQNALLKQKAATLPLAHTKADRTLQISKLHCSEPVYYNTSIHKCSSFIDNHVTESKFGRVVDDLSAIHPQINNVAAESNGILYPKSNFPLNMNSSPLESVSNGKLHISANEDISNFCLLLEQSLSASEELLDRVVRLIEGESEVEEVDKASSGAPPTPLCQSQGECFEGFGASDTVCHSSAKLAALSVMKLQLRQSRENVIGFRGNNRFLRQIWSRQYMASESRLQLSSFLDTEMSDIATDLPHMSDFCSTPRRVTRSIGQVREFPNVQAGTLEYRLKRK